MQLASHVDGLGSSMMVGNQAKLTGPEKDKKDSTHTPDPEPNPMDSTELVIHDGAGPAEDPAEAGDHWRHDQGEYLDADAYLQTFGSLKGFEGMSETRLENPTKVPSPNPNQTRTRTQT